MKLRSAALLWLGSALVDALGARLLDSLDLIDGLLAPSGARLALLIPLALGFYSARLCARLVAPGLALGAVLCALLRRRRAGTAGVRGAAPRE